MDEQYPSYPVFKGLQRPLELFIFQGRYIYWAAATAGGAILGFIILYIAVGFLAGLITFVTSVSVGSALIILKQRKGLHTKREEKGVFVFRRTKE